MTANQNEEDSSTATYKPQQCHRCGGNMGLFTLKDTWKMRVDGVLHDVPVFSIPCQKCLDCGVALLDGTSDETVLWCYNKYLENNGLNTRWHKVQRWFRRRILRIRDRWNYLRRPK
jgi:hypothetical protein